jgi:hypothetical protein
MYALLGNMIHEWEKHGLTRVWQNDAYRLLGVGLGTDDLDLAEDLNVELNEGEDLADGLSDLEETNESSFRHYFKHLLSHLHLSR